MPLTIPMDPERFKEKLVGPEAMKLCEDGTPPLVGEAGITLLYLSYPSQKTDRFSHLKKMHISKVNYIPSVNFQVLC